MTNRFELALKDMEQEMSFEEYMRRHSLAIRLALTIADQQEKIRKLR